MEVPGEFMSLRRLGTPAWSTPPRPLNSGFWLRPGLPHSLCNGEALTLHFVRDGLESTGLFERLSRWLVTPICGATELMTPNLDVTCHEARLVPARGDDGPVNGLNDRESPNFS